MKLLVKVQFVCWHCNRISYPSIGRSLPGLYGANFILEGKPTVGMLNIIL